VIWKRISNGIAFSVVLLCSLASCSEKSPANPGALFTFMTPRQTGVRFNNKVDYSEQFNVYTYRNFYNGAGVGIGDVNNDNLVDIYLCGNMVGNKLYLNKGNFQFEDITERAGVSCGQSWSTGVTMADVNGDGWLDIHVCKSGAPGGEFRYNQLFINNGDMTFSEKSHEWGIDVAGLSVQAAFFDYDHDGDLDCYLLTNSIRSVGNFDLLKDQRQIPDAQGGGNKLFRNTGSKFEDVSSAAGIYVSRIGFGLGVTIGDINADGWEDIYVSNDFFERDYLYVNKGNGTFNEVLEQKIKSLSMGSMGADLADINNDAYPDLFVTEMLPANNARLKTKITFENWNRHVLELDNGYFYQYPRNVLQLNNRDGSFSEVGRLAGVESTDWSWGALIFDMDNDGLKDIFVANGIYKDLLDQDYVNYMADPQTIRTILSKENGVIKKMVDIIPSNPIPNFAFQNTGNLQFKDKSAEWALDQPGFSNGSSYGDLDNDGDLDLVINNLNGDVAIYRNESRQLRPENHYLKFLLKGRGTNKFGFGTRITLESDGEKMYMEQMPARGFQSSVDHRPNFGIGKRQLIDRAIVQWPDGTVDSLLSVLPDQTIELTQGEKTYVYKQYEKR
jgi:hypothetical protein